MAKLSKKNMGKLTNTDFSKVEAIPMEQVVDNSELFNANNIKPIAILEDIKGRVTDYSTTIPALVPVVAYAIKYFAGVYIPDEIIYSAAVALLGLFWKRG